MALPPVEDWYALLAMLSFSVLIACIIGSSFCAVFVAATGFKGSLQYYDSIIKLIGFVFNQVIMSSQLMVLPMFFWHQFNVASSPFPTLIAVAVAWLMSNKLTTLVWKFHKQGMALEVYHLPSEVRGLVRFVLVPNLRSELTDEALRPLARRRAAELRKMMGLDDAVQRALAKPG